MGYKNGSVLLPAELLKQIQDYVDGEYIYIPRLTANRKKWGDKTEIRIMLAERNSEIYRKYKSGVPVRQLSETYCISPQGIYKILSAHKD